MEQNNGPMPPGRTVAMPTEGVSPPYTPLRGRRPLPGRESSGVLSVDLEFPGSAAALEAGPHAAYLLICCLAYNLRTTSGNFIPAVMIEGFADWKRVGTTGKRVAKEAVEAGLLIKIRSGYAVA